MTIILHAWMVPVSAVVAGWVWAFWPRNGNAVEMAWRFGVALAIMGVNLVLCGAYWLGTLQ